MGKAESMAGFVVRRVQNWAFVGDGEAFVLHAIGILTINFDLVLAAGLS